MTLQGVPLPSPAILFLGRKSCCRGIIYTVHVDLGAKTTQLKQRRKQHTAAVRQKRRPCSSPSYHIAWWEKDSLLTGQGKKGTSPHCIRLKLAAAYVRFCKRGGERGGTQTNAAGLQYSNSSSCRVRRPPSRRGGGRSSCREIRPEMVWLGPPRHAGQAYAMV